MTDEAINLTLGEPVLSEPMQLTGTPAQPTFEDIQKIADKHAIDASGAFHLARLHDTKVMKVTRVVETIMRAAERSINWTENETKAIWDRVEEELR
jgi:phage-related minor tail protein